MITFTGDNASQLYMNAMLTILSEGDELAPRGKKILELRPAAFEFTNPLIRTTFLKGRVINPFFQLAEAVWILAGRSDVAWLTQYNANMASFSDDGVHFNAPYGERLRFWNKSAANNFIFNPFDQLRDVYKKIVTDTDTRQAVALIYNPILDHADKDTKDRPCNIALFFKVRGNKLHLTVTNRSNDLHWGVFGANLCQFATIQEAMASWLGVEVGTYTQFTDSLHIYMDDYGAKDTQKILDAYGIHSNDEAPEVSQFSFEGEPRMSLGIDDFDRTINSYFSFIDTSMSWDNTYTDLKVWSKHISNILTIQDPYLQMSFLAMTAYQAHKRGNIHKMVQSLMMMPEGSWKISCLRFLSKRYNDNESFKEICTEYSQNIQDYINRIGE